MKRIVMAGVLMVFSKRLNSRGFALLSFWRRRRSNRQHSRPPRLELRQAGSGIRAVRKKSANFGRFELGKADHIGPMSGGLGWRSHLPGHGQPRLAVPVLYVE